MAAKPPVTATATEPDVPTDQTTFNASMISALQAIAANQPRRRQGMHEVSHDTPWWNPEKDGPRETLTRDFYQNGNPVNPVVLSNEEIRLINQIKPGVYAKKKFRVTPQPGGGIGLWYDNKTLHQRFTIARIAGESQGLTGILQMILTEEEAQKDRRKKGFDPYDE
jgi:hypothetical protein